eukprot:3799429-Rhodomonas_salina.4
MSTQTPQNDGCSSICCAQTHERYHTHASACTHTHTHSVSCSSMRDKHTPKASAAAASIAHVHSSRYLHALVVEMFSEGVRVCLELIENVREVRLQQHARPFQHRASHVRAREGRARQKRS